MSQPSARSWDSYFYSYVHEDGHSLDEAREHWADLCDLADNHHLRLIDLSNPQLAERFPGLSQIVHHKYRAEFDERWSAGLPRAIPRRCPDGVDLTPYDEIKRWGDRRAEEGEKDVNVALYRLFYKQRVTPFWDEQERRRSLDVEIIEVSEDGETWRPANEREKRGWDYQYLEKARYRAEHGHEPLNSYQREIQEDEAQLLAARAAKYDRSDDMSRAQYEARVRAAEAAVQRARENY